MLCLSIKGGGDFSVDRKVTGLTVGCGVGTKVREESEAVSSLLRGETEDGDVDAEEGVSLELRDLVLLGCSESESSPFRALQSKQLSSGTW